MATAAAVLRSAGTQHWNNAWPTASGVAPVDRVPTRPRRNHLRQLGSEGAKRLRLEAIAPAAWRYSPQSARASIPAKGGTHRHGPCLNIRTQTVRMGLRRRTI